MGYQDRKVLYEKIEKNRRRPLISYVTTTRPNVRASMSNDVLPSIIRQIEAIPNDQKEVDFLIISNGGDPIASLKIINILRERFKKISVLLPNVAYSAATVLALGADDIVMHPYSNLGPVDPQLTVYKENSAQSFSTEDVSNYISFLKNDVGITDQEHLSSAFNTLAQSLGPLNIGFSKKSLQLTISLGRRMLESHLKDKSKAESIVNTLCSSYYHHGYAVSRREADKIGLNVISPDEELTSLLWNVWQDFSKEMKCDRAFNPVIEAFEDKEVENLINSVPVINFPAGLPTDLANRKMQQIANELAVVPRKPVRISNLVASCESKNLAFEYRSDFDVLVWRKPSMEIGANISERSSAWKDETPCNE